MDHATKWHKDGHRCNKEIYQLVWGICGPVQVVFLCAFSEITIYGNYLLFLWMEMLQNCSEDAQTIYKCKLQLGLAKFIHSCRRNSRISED